MFPDSFESIYHFNEKASLFITPIQITCILKVRKLHAECQIPAAAREWCQIVFLYNIPKVIPKY